MCILFLELCDNPQPGGYRLILASNRDEHYRRPTDNAHLWQEAPNVIGGRDQEPGREGGTWLALDTAGYGRLSVLLNVLGGPSTATTLPRGHLVADFVRGREHARDFIARVAQRGLEYNAFHLVTIDLNPECSGLWHYSNCSAVDGVGSDVTHLKRGCFGLGNSLIQEPFKKVSAGKQRFGDVLGKYGSRKEHREQLVRELVDLLKWKHSHYPDDKLEARAAVAKISQESAKMISSIFQRHPTYGTRTHTIILVDDSWRCDYYEWTLEPPVDPDTSRWVETHKTFQLGPKAS